MEQKEKKMEKDDVLDLMESEDEEMEVDEGNLVISLSGFYDDLPLGNISLRLWALLFKVSGTYLHLLSTPVTDWVAVDVIFRILGMTRSNLNSVFMLSQAGKLKTNRHKHLSRMNWDVANNLSRKTTKRRY